MGGKLGYSEDSILTDLHVAGREGACLEHLDRGISKCSVVVLEVCGVERRERANF